MLALLTPVDYWYGYPPLLTLDPSSDTRTMSRRMSQSSTLDGGAVVNDSGYSHADREMRLVIRDLTPAIVATLEEIAAYPLCRLALDHGLYLGRVRGYAFNGGASASVTFTVAAKIV